MYYFLCRILNNSGTFIVMMPSVDEVSIVHKNSQ